MSGEKESKMKRSFARLYPDKRLTVPQKTFRLSKDVFPDDPVAFEIQFMEDVLKRDPCHEPALHFLGHAYTARGEYERGLHIDERLARLRPHDPIVFYNLACSLALLKKLDDALAALRRAIELGYADLGHMLRDPDLANLRADRRFKELCALLIQRKK